MSAKVPDGRWKWLSLGELKELHPGLHEELLDLCTSLDKEEFPEAALISSGKTRTVAGLARIYDRLVDTRKSKAMQKRLKQAENIIMTMSTLRVGRVSRGPVLEREPIRPPPGLVHLEAAAHMGGTSAIPKIETKIANGIVLTVQETITFAQEGYRRFLDKLRRSHRESQEKMMVIKCSDSRLLIGDLIFDLDMRVYPHAGNAFKNQPENEGNIVVVVGHNGFGGCGAVGAAKEKRRRGEKVNDPALASVTTDAIPKQVTDAKRPSLANIVYQALEAERAGKTAYGIYVNIETREIRVVHGKENDFTRRLIQSIQSTIPTQGMEQQKAGFIIATRAGESFSGKAKLNAGANQVFDINFLVKEGGSVELSVAAEGSARLALDGGGYVELARAGEGSAKYALEHVKGVEESKIILVVDRDDRVLRRARDLLQRRFPQAKVVALHEDEMRWELVELAA